MDYLTTHTSLSPIRREFANGCVKYKKRWTWIAAASDKVYQLLAHGQWFSSGTPASSTTKTGRHDIAEILLKVALNTKNQINQSFFILNKKSIIVQKYAKKGMTFEHYWGRSMCFNAICEFDPRSWQGVLDTTLCDKFCQWLATGQWFSPGIPVSSTNKIDCHDITEILLKVALNTINLNPQWHFQQYVSIMSVLLGGNLCIWWKQLTCCKSQTNFIT